ncbi:MAG: hypothetical protein IPK58_01125 [Acidobacteria bacterium]|nr:hypothetical protein [Acidobacteriota bacterium]
MNNFIRLHLYSFHWPGVRFVNKSGAIGTSKIGYLCYIFVSRFLRLVLVMTRVVTRKLRFFAVAWLIATLVLVFLIRPIDTNGDRSLFYVSVDLLKYFVAGIISFALAEFSVRGENSNSAVDLGNSEQHREASFSFEETPLSAYSDQNLLEVTKLQLPLQEQVMLAELIEKNREHAISEPEKLRPSI